MQALRNPNDPRQVQEVVNNIVKQFDNYGIVTLQNASTSTVVENGKCRSVSVVVLQALNADAATTNTHIEAQDNQFVITHDSGTTERKFAYVIFGV
jgi:hypothetical protein